MTSNDFDKSIQQFVLCVQSWIGTPYVPQGRKINRSADCLAPILDAVTKSGIDISFRTDYQDYDQVPPPELFDDLDKYLVKIWGKGDPIQEPDVGDILVFGSIGCNKPRHLAVYTGKSVMTHTWSKVGRVCEHSIDAAWRRLLVSFYRIPKEVKWQQSY